MRFAGLTGCGPGFLIIDAGLTMTCADTETKFGVLFFKARIFTYFLLLLHLKFIQK